MFFRGVSVGTAIAFLLAQPGYRRPGPVSNRAGNRAEPGWNRAALAELAGSCYFCGMEETRSTLQVVRDAIAIVRDVFLIAAMIVTAYVVISAGAKIHQIEQQTSFTGTRSELR